MKITLAPSTNSVKSKINFCKKQQSVVSCKTITVDWALNVIRSKCSWSSKQCKLAVVPSEMSYAKYFSIDTENIRLGGGNNSVDFKVSFSPDMFCGTEVIYHVELLYNGNVLGKSEDCTIELEFCEDCNACLERSNNRIFVISSSIDKLVCSDETYRYEKMEIATLNIDISQQERSMEISDCVLHVEALNNADRINCRFAANDCLFMRYDGSYSVNIPKCESKVSIPMFIDMRNIHLPEAGLIEDNRLILRFVAKYKLCGQDIEVSEEFVYPITLDNEFVKMSVAVSEFDMNCNEKTTAIVANSYNTLLPVMLSSQDSEFIVKQFKIINTANQKNVRLNGNFGLRIRNIRFRLISQDKDRIEGTANWDREVSEEILLQAGETWSYNIKFIFSEIKNVSVRDHKGFFDWNLFVSFEYVEDRSESYVNDGFHCFRVKEQDWAPYECTLSARIFRVEPKEWYSVDFGTSAVVACCLTRDYDERIISLIDLKIKKNQLLLETYPDDETKRKDNSENTDNLISSSLFLNVAGRDTKYVQSRLERKDFKNQVIWFSPSSSMPPQSANHQLPCLKNMMGHENIPQIPLLQKGGNKLLQTKVCDIMQAAYNQLFSYYFDSNIEALVLTVPNTFTTIHLKQLKDIVLNNLSSLRDDMLVFVSESDSVLCSYVADRQAQRLTTDTKERVLVYDMGAGTLDVTYAVCEFKENGCVIDIQEKVGVNKAGNYIDFLLGEIICDLIENKENNSNFSKIISERLLNLKPSENAREENRKLLKDYLRNNIKVKLNDNVDALLPQLVLKNIPVFKFKNTTFKDILEHEFFKNYLNSCTNKVIENLFNSKDNPHNIDVVLLSGRSVSITSITDAIKTAIKTAIGEVPRFLNISENSGYTLKTVVSKGALDYMRMTYFNTDFRIVKKKVYGFYGVLVLGKNRLDWYPLIDKNSQPIDSTVESNLYEYEKRREIGLDGAETVCLCHSFCMDTKTEAQNNCFDSISILHRYQVPMNTGNFEHTNLSVDLKLTSMDKLEYMIGNTKVKDLYPCDDYNNESLRKSLWPVIYY